MINKHTFISLGLIISVIMNVLLINKLWMENEPATYKSDNSEINFAFSEMHNDPKTLLLEAIKQAKERLDIAIYNMEDEDIVQAILNAKNRGVNVRLITDAKKAEKDSQADILETFSKHDIVVKVNKSHKMHLKMAIIDENQIVTGSYNYTEASAKDNLEQIIVISNDELAAEWSNIYSNLWNQEEFVIWESFK